jgi:hypothetical protein
MSEADNFAAGEQYAHLELNAVMSAIHKGTLDFTRPIHVPSRNPNETLDRLSARVPVYIMASIDELHGNGRKYKDRTQAVVQALCMLIVYESHSGDEQSLDPAIIKAEQDREDAERTMIEQTVASCEKLIQPGASVDTMNRLLNRLELLRIVCEKNGYDQQLRDVDRAIHGCRWFTVRHHVDEAFDS